MNTKFTSITDLAQASELLWKFYNGQLQPRLVTELSHWLTANRNSLPPEMQADADFLKTLTSMQTPATAATIPAAKEAGIRQALHTAQNKSIHHRNKINTRRKLNFFITAGASATAAAIALLIVFKTGNNGENPEQEPTVASVNIESKTPIVSDINSGIIRSANKQVAGVINKATAIDSFTAESSAELAIEAAGAISTGIRTATKSLAVKTSK